MLIDWQWGQQLMDTFMDWAHTHGMHGYHITSLPHMPGLS